jgi:UMF1 family MFS transporter
MRPVLERLALHRPELRAWALYDWANSVYVTSVLATLLPLYFRTVASDSLPQGAATARFAMATAFAVTIVALISPFLGALADFQGARKVMLKRFLTLGVMSTAALALVGPGDWALCLSLFIAGNVGASASIVFYNSLLPHVARPDEVNRLSTSGFALGYLSGGLVLAVSLLLIQKHAAFGLPDTATAIRVAFLIAALWWAIFSIPVLRFVKEPPRLPATAREHGRSIGSIVLGRLTTTLSGFRAHRDASLMLLGYLLYNDGVNTIIRMAAIYATDIGISRTAMLAGILMVQFIGIPFAFLAGSLADRVGIKRVIFLTLFVYVIIAWLGYRMTEDADFLVLAGLVGLVQGGAQGLGRSLFASLVPRHKSAEMFGFFGVFDKFGGVIGSAFFALMVSLTGSGRLAILGLSFLFVAGASVLAFVNVERGRAAAREAEEQG